MRKFLFLLFSFTLIVGFSKANWTAVSNFGGGNREIAIYFTIKNKGYVGCGVNNNIWYDDLWEYDANANSWTQKANYPSGGGGLVSPGIFVINDLAYIISGESSNGGYYNRVYYYDPFVNAWTQKNNFPGAARYSTVGFSIGSFGYITTGFNGSLLTDFWKYNSLNDTWSQLTDFPGGVRQHISAVTVNGRAFVGLGFNGSHSFDDWWEFDATNISWSPKATFPGGGRRGAIALPMNGNAYISAGYNSSIYFNDLWEYFPASDTWLQLDSFPAPPRYGPAGFTISNCIYVGTGSNDGIILPFEFNDMFKRCEEEKPNAIDEINTDEISIISNCTHGQLIIENNSEKRNSMILKLFSSDGREVLSRIVNLENQKTNIDIDNFPIGIYFYSLLNSKEDQVFKGKLEIK